MVSQYCQNPREHRGRWYAEDTPIGPFGWYDWRRRRYVRSLTARVHCPDCKPWAAWNTTNKALVDKLPTTNPDYPKE